MKFFATISLFLISFLGYAQNDSLIVLHYYKPDKGLMLKWLPGNFDVFREGFKKGYNVYRSEVKVINGIEKTIGFERLNSKPIRYWNLDQLNAELPKDSSLESAVIFVEGASEILNRPVPDNVNDAMKETQSQGFLHLLGSFAAIHRNRVAEAMGLYFVDESVSPEKKYLYKIEVESDKEIFNHLLVFPLNNASKEKVMGLSARLTPGAVYLRWFNNGNNNYPYYNIYRSNKKGGNYKKLNVLPMVGTQGNAQFNKNISTFIDSINSYNETYYYKVIGINAFEAEGIPSEPVEITTNYLLTTAPVISDSKNPQEQDIEISWAVSPKDQPHIKGYNVFRAGSATGIYNKVNKELIKPNKLTFLDQTEKSSSNYYRVSAYGSSGDSLTSMLFGHLLVDSIPPGKPEILSGVCDTNGIITLTWKNNPEKDMLGYRIFKTDRLEGEPLRVIPGHIPDTSIVDTVDLKRPFNKVYYRIAALDLHFNPSVPSDYFTVELPDINPPTNGNFREYEVGMSGITLSWDKSNAYDLKAMHLIRKSDEEFDFKTILSLSGDSLEITSFTDTSTKSFVNYQYVLEAEDQAGLLSAPSKPLVVQQLDKRKISAVTGLRAIVSRDNKMIKLSWDFPAYAKGFKIYRSRNNGPLETYEFVKGDKREYYDTWLKPRSTYTYLMVAELPEGYESGYSNKIEVKY